MRNGRPPLRHRFRRDILQVLGENPYPLTARSIKQRIDARRLHPCGWHTVRKYLDELAAERLVLRQALPTRARARPLIVYLGRGRPNP